MRGGEMSADGLLPDVWVAAVVALEVDSPVTKCRRSEDEEERSAGPRM